MKRLDLVLYLREMRQLTQAQMAEILGCSRYRLIRLEVGEGDLFVEEWLALIEWLGKSPVLCEDGFYLGDESHFLNPSLLNFGVLRAPLSSVFLGMLGHSFSKEWPEVIKELGLPRFYFLNLANPMPGVVVLRLLQKVVSRYGSSLDRSKSSKRGHLFLELSADHNFLDPEILKWEGLKQRGQHFCQQWNLTGSVDSRFEMSEVGHMSLTLKCRCELFSHILFHDQVLSDLSLEYLKDIIELVVGERLEFTTSLKSRDTALCFEGWCRR